MLDPALPEPVTPGNHGNQPGSPGGGSATAGDDSVMPEDQRRAYVEEMGLLWEREGLSRMQGRVLGYLMLSNQPQCSSAELAEALAASTGSISTATRALAEAGYIRRVALRGQRSHYFRADDDVWAAFLSGERDYLHRQRDYATTVLDSLGPGDVGPRKRMANMRDYMSWIEEQHRRTRLEWEEFKRRRDEAEHQR